MTEQVLMSCPFCGGDELVGSDVWSQLKRKYVHSIECKGCGGSAPMEQWLARPTPAPIPDAAEGVAFQADADEAFREWEKSGQRIPAAIAYMSARDGFRAGAAWQAIVSALRDGGGVPDGLGVALFNALESYRKEGTKFHKLVDKRIHAEQCELLRKFAATLLAAPAKPEGV